MCLQIKKKVGCKRQQILPMTVPCYSTIVIKICTTDITANVYVEKVTKAKLRRLTTGVKRDFRPHIQKCLQHFDVLCADSAFSLNGQIVQNALN